MSASDKTNNLKPGPIEVSTPEYTKVPPHYIATSLVSSELIASPAGAPPLFENHEHTLVRNINCSNYQRCLNLAATLDWESFSCEGCTGEINESLLWRAGQRMLKDSVAKALCGPGTVFIRKSEKE